MISILLKESSTRKLVSAEKLLDLQHITSKTLIDFDPEEKLLNYQIIVIFFNELIRQLNLNP